MQNKLILTVLGASLCTGQAMLTVVSAADYTDFPLAPDSLVSMFAENIATGTSTANPPPSGLPTSLAGVSATITDASKIPLPIGLIAVSPSQVNAVLPSSLRAGDAVVTLTKSNGSRINSRTFTVGTVAPSLFTADQSGKWLAAAQVVVVHKDGSQSFMSSVAKCTSSLVWNGSTWSGCVPIPINLGSSTDVAVLELFGTGIRGVSSVVAVCPKCGYDPVSLALGSSPGNYLSVLYAGAQALGGPSSFPGLDQINIVLPHSMAGAGVIALRLTVLAGYINGVGMGITANTVYVDIQ